MPNKPGGKFAEIRRQRKEKERAEQRKADDRRYNRERTDGEITKLYNSARWRKIRWLKLRNNPLCEVCEKEGRYTKATLVHHVVEAKQDPSLFYRMRNLQSLCEGCHEKIHRRGVK